MVEATDQQAAPRFLVKAGVRSRGKNSVVVADEIGVFHPIIFRVAGTVGGVFNEMKSTGKRDQEKFEITVREGTLGTGLKTSRSHNRAHADATAASAKKVIRQLRPQEEEKLDAIDAARRDLYAKLEALGTERDELIREAFSKGNVVRVAELEQMAADFEQEQWGKEKA